ncbi:helix-turn-helix transcriptional regulator [Lichenibacterium ramalinae]|uniref:XRE family transcriptional regulator n=1 Tax=Lichenibacterium ramalinae TaxID=2316527 RepID=A0A4Q2RDN3_9HYPH|nr:helix-turn-helix transcriptional regulator [Lichenibacterium ramalinae]RYB04463.1 XRE family transcriptional regulator [Lichenibacterium ramalinae]
MTPVQLRAARLILNMTQGDLAVAAEVSRATINRYESGVPVGAGQVRLMRFAIEAAGAVFIPDGTTVDGVVVFGGVGMRSPPAAARPDEGTGQ